MILKSKRLFLKTASIWEIRNCLKNKTNPIEKMDVEVAHDWPSKEFIEGADFIIDGILSSNNQLTSEGSCWWLWWIILNPDLASASAGTLIGYIGFKGRPTQSGDIEITYSIVNSARGNRLAAEATNCLVNWAFQQKNVKRIIADTSQFNAASQKTLLKAGFKLIKNSVILSGDLNFELVAKSKK